MIEDPLEHRGEPAAALGAGSRGARHRMPGNQAAETWIAGYRLERQIGAGGMAVVYRAIDERLGRTVALKVMASSMAADAMYRERFTRESRAAAAVDDPHIIPVYEAGDADGVLFIAMRFVNGGDVGSLLQREGRLRSARVASIISPVASALDAAHAVGLVHRDVKPANMLLDTRPGRPDHVYLSDFGLSKAARSVGKLTGTGQFMGTPDYTAPEQIEGLPVDGRADQYALACTVFELLTGNVIFAASEGWAIVYAHLSKPPPPVTSFLPDLPPAADQVLAKALAKDPRHRYPTCRQFADALRDALGVAPYHLDTGSGGGFAGAGAGVDAGAAPDAGVTAGAGVTALGGATEPSRSRRVETGVGAAGRRPRRRLLAWLVLGAAAALAIVVMAHRALVASAPPDHSTEPPLYSRVGAFTAPVKPGVRQEVSFVAFSPDGRTLATGLVTGGSRLQTSGETDLWNVDTGQRTLILPEAGGAEAFGPGGKVLAVAAGTQDEVIDLRNPVTGKQVGNLAEVDQGGIAAVEFAADGQVLATLGGGGEVVLRSMITGQSLRVIGGAPLPPYATAMAISPNGKTLATGETSRDGNSNKVFLWNVATGRHFATLTAPKGPFISSVAFSPGGTKLAVSVAGNGGTSILNPASGKLLARFTDPGSQGVNATAFSPNGAMLATADSNGRTYLWNVRAKSLTAALVSPAGAEMPRLGKVSPHAVFSIAFSPSGKTLATSDTNGSAYLWRVG